MRESIDTNEVTILIPTLNEATTIGTIISDFISIGYTNILVVDGDSTDNTRRISRKLGAQVVIQDGKGKGDAVRTALEHINTEYTVLIDGDMTYAPDEVHRLVHPLQNGDADEVIGNRFANMKQNAMKPLHQAGNRLINLAFFVFTRDTVDDLLSGYRAYKTAVLKELEITENGFGIETEITTKISVSNYSTRVVPITYSPRPVGSEANLNSFTDGFEIMRTLAVFTLTK